SGGISFRGGVRSEGSGDDGDDEDVGIGILDDKDKGDCDSLFLVTPRPSSPFVTTLEFGSLGRGERQVVVEIRKGRDGVKAATMKVGGSES
ncbi:hypothetical protein HDU76_008547, partial [Blyttiomyces sp. JEL0837]